MGLTCKAQLDKVTNKVYWAFWMLKSTFVKLRSGSESNILVVHHGIWSTLACSAKIWWPRVKYSTTRAKLCRLWKLLAVKRTASTVVLEVLLGLLLHLKIEAVNFILSYHVALKNVGITGIAAACNHSITLPIYICGEWCGTVGLGTALWAGRLWVWFPMVSFEYFIDLFLPIALWPCSQISLYQKWVPRMPPGGYRLLVHRADNLTTFMCQLSRNLGASTLWNPRVLSRPVQG